MHKSGECVLGIIRNLKKKNVCPHNDPRSPTDDEHSWGTQRLMTIVSYTTFPDFQNAYYYY